MKDLLGREFELDVEIQGASHCNKKMDQSALLGSWDVQLISLKPLHVCVSVPPT